MQGILFEEAVYTKQIEIRARGSDDGALNTEASVPRNFRWPKKSLRFQFETQNFFSGPKCDHLVENMIHFVENVIN